MKLEYAFSPSGNTFYPLSIRQLYIDSGTWPSDGIEVSEDIFKTFACNVPPNGKVLGSDSSGYPCWIDVVETAPSKNEISRAARSHRDNFLISTDKLMVSDYSINNELLTDEETIELKNIRQEFRLWTEKEGWPLIPLPDIPLWILIEAANNGYVYPTWPNN